MRAITRGLPAATTGYCGVIASFIGAIAAYRAISTTFLRRFSAEKRKNAKRERRRVAELAGVTFRNAPRERGERGGNRRRV
jgi:hypothetical protein